MKIIHHIRPLIFLLAILGIFFTISYFKSNKKPEPIPVVETALYTGKVYHVFFHSLIVYPQLAFDGSEDSRGYSEYMITKSEFEKILPKLYENDFVLIDPHLLYTTQPDGSILKNDLYIPIGKKPLILSLDDVNYYKDKRAHGFANRLVLDRKGKVSTEINTPEGQTIVTRDGDTIPMIDDFIEKHPDFSFQGAKGVIAVTGYQGILGYETNLLNSPKYNENTAVVRKIVDSLKKTGWQFASHSYTHEMPFRDNSISLAELTRDTERWDKEVRPLVGDTDMFVGPFGQVFQPFDPRREYLVSKGFKSLFGVGMDLYLAYFPNYIMMDRANIDGIRLMQSPNLLYEYFDPSEVIDPMRKVR